MMIHTVQVGVMTGLVPPGSFASHTEVYQKPNLALNVIRLTLGLDTIYSYIELHVNLAIYH